MRRFIPLGNRVTIEIEFLRMTKGGLHVPDNVKQNEITGIVKELGPDVKFLKLGDRVMVNPRVGAGMVEGEIAYRIMQESEVICVVDGESDSEPVIEVVSADAVIKDGDVATKADGGALILPLVTK